MTSCGHCGRGFEGKRAWQRFCSQTCRWAWHVARKRPGEEIRRACEVLRTSGYPNAASCLELKLGRGAA